MVSALHEIVEWRHNYDNFSCHLIFAVLYFSASILFTNLQWFFLHSDAEAVNNLNITVCSVMLAV